MAAGKMLMMTLATLAVIGHIFPLAAHAAANECTSQSTGGPVACDYTLAKDDTFKLNCAGEKSNKIPDELLATKPNKEVCWNEAGTKRTALTGDCAAKKKLTEFAASKITITAEDEDGFTIKNEGYTGSKKLILDGVCANSSSEHGVYFNVTFPASTTPVDPSGAAGTTIGVAAASGVAALLGLYHAF